MQLGVDHLGFAPVFGADARTGGGELRQVRSYAALVPVALRLVMLPAATVVVAGTSSAVLPLVFAVLVLAVGDAVGLAWTLRDGRLDPRLLDVSLVLGVLANLTVAATVPSTLFLPATTVTGAHLAVTVLLWTLTRGARLAVIPVLADIPMQLAMGRLAGGDRYGFEAAGLAGLVLVLGGSMLMLRLLGLSTRAAVQVGAQAERARQLRDMHDTVLQTLEAIALQAPLAGDDPELILRRLRGMARGQAIEIRRALDDLTGTVNGTLAEELRSVAAELAPWGLLVELTVADDVEVAPAAVPALRDAAREALRNVLKHAGVGTAVVSLAGGCYGVRVVVRDHGTGFDPCVPTDGFGLRQSIRARLADVGGSADVWSAPGRGTRITLCAPSS